VNEDDFEGADDEARKAAYQKFVNLYIGLYYEPLDEEMDEARYFTRDFDRALLAKMRANRASATRKIASIEVLPSPLSSKQH
jgi:hypothetical protein